MITNAFKLSIPSLLEQRNSRYRNKAISSPHSRPESVSAVHWKSSLFSVPRRNEIQNTYLLGFKKRNLETSAASISTQGVWFVSLTDFMPLIFRGIAPLSVYVWGKWHCSCLCRRRHLAAPASNAPCLLPVWTKSLRWWKTHLTQGCSVPHWVPKVLWLRCGAVRCDAPMLCQLTERFCLPRHQLPWLWHNSTDNNIGPRLQTHLLKREDRQACSSLCKWRLTPGLLHCRV